MEEQTAFATSFCNIVQPTEGVSYAQGISFLILFFVFILVLGIINIMIIKGKIKLRHRDLR